MCLALDMLERVSFPIFTYEIAADPCPVVGLAVVLKEVNEVARALRRVTNGPLEDRRRERACIATFASPVISCRRLQT